MSRVNCDIVRDLLPSYLDGICSESSRKAVEQHTSECRECQASLERLKILPVMRESSLVRRQRPERLSGKR